MLLYETNKTFLFLTLHNLQLLINNSINLIENFPQVVDEHTTVSKPEPKNHNTHILKSDWFWYTIQNGYANEMDYLFGDVSALSPFPAVFSC